MTKKALKSLNCSPFNFMDLFANIFSFLHLVKTYREHSFKIELDIVVIDHNSKKEDLIQIKRQLNKSNFKNSIINLNIKEFANNIKSINAKN